MRTSLIILPLIALSSAVTVNVITSGVFHNCTSECFIENNGTTVRWGTPTIEDLLSGLEFSGTTVELTTSDDPKIIGNLTHNNWPINGPVPAFVGLNITITAVDLDTTTIPFTLQVNETFNEEPCAFNSTIPCADRIRFITPFNLEYSFSISETQYTLYIDGIMNNGKLSENFITQEREVTTGQIEARLIAVCAENATCNEDQCVIGECLEGFCHYNYTVLNGQDCETIIPSGYDSQCYNTQCLNGDCLLDTESYNGNSCSLPVPKSLDGQCYTTKCSNGICDIVTDTFNGLKCETNVPEHFNDVCYDTQCFDGDCIIDTIDYDGNICHTQDSEDLDPQCYIADCLDGSCIIDTELFDNKVCKKEDLNTTNLDSQCYQIICVDGDCILNTDSFDKATCFVDDCEGNCLDGTCNTNCNTRSIEDDSDDDDDNLLPLLSLLALLCCLPLLCCCLLLPCLLIPFLFLTQKSVPNAVAVRSGADSVSQALNSPLYEGLGTGGDNPLYDL